MTSSKSLDSVRIISALVSSAHRAIGQELHPNWVRLTIQKIEKRFQSEGIGLFTKTFPTLGKALDRALSGNRPLNSTELRLAAKPGSQLPKLFGELFERVLTSGGSLLPEPDAKSVALLRTILYAFYRYKLPYVSSQEVKVISAFRQAELDLSQLTAQFIIYETELDREYSSRRVACNTGSLEVNHLSETLGYPTLRPATVLRESRILLSRVFSGFDPHDIVPRHGPGAVATKQQHKAKYLWSNICQRLIDQYPLDAYFYASQGHVCDNYRMMNSITNHDLPARVCLVPKDSRGPRLISAEPVDFQWIQQGLSKAIVDRVESHPLSKGFVNFTDQTINRDLALKGSITGEYVTLDLKEASDRIHVSLVRLLFPQHISDVLMACRSLATTLPSGELLPLTKYAPMGSALCFPVLALSVWAILRSAACDEHVRKNIFVYGDDVIVPKHYAMCAIRQLETFGLLVNRDKSCLQGFFRESCGMDAFLGVDVTPVRLKTVWTSSPSPESYSSWVSYHNSYFQRGYYDVCAVIREMLQNVYRSVPGPELENRVPSLAFMGIGNTRRRWSYHLQRWEYRVYSLGSSKERYDKDDWVSLLRFFTEVARPDPRTPAESDPAAQSCSKSDLGVYTHRRRTSLRFRWT